MQKASLLLSCEHARNAVPPQLQSSFRKHRALLASHRGYDEGALELGRILKRELRAPLFEGRYSRLVIDLNRSFGHPKAFSEITRRLPIEEQEALIAAVHWPFRELFRDAVAAVLARKRAAIHLSVHTFTPVFEGETRNCEIGLLYDPRKRLEATLATELRHALVRIVPGVRVRMNYPYRGSADGHTTALRKAFGPGYLGIEIEINQGWLRRLAKDKSLVRTSKLVSRACREAIEARYLVEQS